MLRSLGCARDDRRGRPAATTDERGWTRMASAASYRSNETRSPFDWAQGRAQSLCSRGMTGWARSTVGGEGGDRC